MCVTMKGVAGKIELMFSETVLWLDGGYIKLGKCLLQRMYPLCTGWIEL